MVQYCEHGFPGYYSKHGFEFSKNGPLITMRIFRVSSVNTNLYLCNKKSIHWIKCQNSRIFLCKMLFKRKKENSRRNKHKSKIITLRGKLRGGQGAEHSSSSSFQVFLKPLDFYKYVTLL